MVGSVVSIGEEGVAAVMTAGVPRVGMVAELTDLDSTAVGCIVGCRVGLEGVDGALLTGGGGVEEDKVVVVTGALLGKV